MKIHLSRPELRRRAEELGRKLTQLERRVLKPEETREIAAALP